MPSISEALAIAAQHHQTGRLGLAAEIYRRVLTAEPQHCDALERLSVLEYQQGRHRQAIELMRRAIEIEPGRAEFHFNLASMQSAAGLTTEAIASLLEALRLDPGLAEAQINLGRLYRAAGRIDEAIACFRRAIALRPDLSRPHTSLGNLYAEQGRWPEAVVQLRQAVECDPNRAEPYNNLGNALHHHGQSSEAIACFERALTLKPDFAMALNNLGNVWHDLGELHKAVECYRRAVTLAPTVGGFQGNLGNAWLELGNVHAALDCYQHAVTLRPEVAEFHGSLGRAWRTLGQLEQAAQACRRAVELKPDYPVALNNLAGVYKDQGRIDDALECYDRALAIKPDYAEAHSNRLCALRYRAATTPQELLQAGREFERRFAAPLHRLENAGQSPHAPLRLGFVSPSFGFGATGYFLIRALEHLDRQRCTVTCYSDRAVPDAMTARFRAASDVWRETLGVADEALAARIRDDGIDVLFDLTGHAPHNRLLVFARRPAPLQITWLDSVGTTGLAAMDYVLADPYQIPADADNGYAERVLRMPASYVCYDPPDDAPAVGPLPAFAAGHVTFGCFNNPAKITADVVTLWAEILRRVPDSRLLLKYRGLDDRATGDRYRRQFAECGVAGTRVDLEGASPHAELLRRYLAIDLALDPLYNGGLTTCEALWMGVPVVTWPGTTYPRRHSLSHLSNVGLTETIAGSRDEYVALAVRLAGELPHLAELRAGLRQRVAQSPLCDGRRFAEQLLDLLFSRSSTFVR
jgi:predicted O-linked N-acetylglucosamine transferase (SPINDLY family)